MFPILIQMTTCSLSLSYPEASLPWIPHALWPLHPCLPPPSYSDLGLMFFPQRPSFPPQCVRLAIMSFYVRHYHLPNVSPIFVLCLSCLLFPLLRAWLREGRDLPVLLIIYGQAHGQWAKHVCEIHLNPKSSPSDCVKLQVPRWNPSLCGYT